MRDVKVRAFMQTRVTTWKLTSKSEARQLMLTKGANLLRVILITAEYDPLLLPQMPDLPHQAHIQS